MNALYSTRATAHGGRTGRVTSDDGKVDVALSIPRQLGGDGGAGTNPETLFAAGYAACFESALRLVARQRKVTLPPETGISAQVGLVRTEAGSYQLEVALTGHLPGLAPAEAHALLEAAHQV